MDPIRDNLLREVLEAMDGATHDEWRILAAIAGRLRIGRAHYGPMQLATDRREPLREACEELVDAVVYLTMRALRTC